MSVGGARWGVPSLAIPRVLGANALTWRFVADAVLEGITRPRSEADAGGMHMKHWRRRRHVAGTDPAPLTPAQVQALREHQDRGGRRLVRLFLWACFAGGLSHIALFMSLGASDYGLAVALSVVDTVLVLVAFLLVHDNREVQGAALALVVASTHILWLCTQVSASESAESLLFPVALAPFVMIRRELPALRLGIASFAIAVYLVCELAFPAGSGAHPLPEDFASGFATANRVIAAGSLLVLIAIIQHNMSSTRRILQGAARYGELRATTDELTGVYNRRPIIAQLSEWTQRGRGNYAIALIDLDHFKTINDEFGHDCGDTIIQAVALTLRSHFRDTDMVSRWGGDEFLVLMPGVRHSDLYPVLERLRRAISLIEERCAEHVHHVTVSIGASMGAKEQTSDECIAAADHALYRAKAEGRNKVVAVGVNAPTQALGRPAPDDGDTSWPRELSDAEPEATAAPPKGFVAQR